MAIGSHGENLIFLVSQPRAGSTMLQRMLGAHSQIHTVAEPWVMLHPLYALRERAMKAPYDARWAYRALTAFLDTLPEQEMAYAEGVRRMYSYLYNQALEGSGKTLFLDKTPRYYFILQELQQVFPQARFVLLMRNPLAVLASILSTWVQQEWYKLARYQHDLLYAPQALVAARTSLGEAAHTLSYEDLVSTPEGALTSLCEHLQVPYEPSIISYGEGETPAWTLGDKITVDAQTAPVSHSLEKWKHALQDPQVWRLMDGYLNALGPELVAQMGYDEASLRAQVEAVRPARRALRWTLGFEEVVDVKNQPRWQQVRQQMKTVLYKEGVAGLVRLRRKT